MSSASGRFRWLAVAQCVFRDKQEAQLTLRFYVMQQLSICKDRETDGEREKERGDYKFKAPERDSQRTF